MRGSCGMSMMRGTLFNMVSGFGISFRGAREQYFGGARMGLGMGRWIVDRGGIWRGGKGKGSGGGEVGEGGMVLGYRDRKGAGKGGRRERVWVL